MGAASILDNTVSISTLNHGGASKTLGKVSDDSPVVVMRNNKPSAVIITPTEYQRLTDAEEDFALYREAMERLHAADGHFISHHDAFGDQGFDYTDNELDDVKFE